jgi:hemerythrin-like domain-containing protein
MNTLPRRSTIAASASVTGWAVAPCYAQAKEAPATEVAAAVTAPEDLMREHGVLNRLMLVYEAALAPPESARENIHEVLQGAASLIRSFIEDYHGMLEEKFLFPDFDRQGRLTSLVKTLREQHRVGRMLTGVILRQATADGLADDATRAEVTRACRDFVRMFRAHEAWEDTELFPAFRGLVSPARLAELGEQFEEIEHRTFGKDGFADTVRKVVQMEHRVGIQGPDAYTPRKPAEVSP